jgi:uncharacterized protein YbjT (DUF2867 family)
VTTPLSVAVTGASGYIGGRLVPLLLVRGHRLSLLSRDPGRLAGRFDGPAVVAADLLRPETLPSALAGIDVAYYLAHSMAVGQNTPAFFGAIDLNGFDWVTVSASGAPLVGFDQLAYSGNAVPEPGSLLLLGTGLVGLGRAWRKRRG